MASKRINHPSRTSSYAISYTNSPNTIAATPCGVWGACDVIASMTVMMICRWSSARVCMGMPVYRICQCPPVNLALMCTHIMCSTLEPCGRAREPASRPQHTHSRTHPKTTQTAPNTHSHQIRRTNVPPTSGVRNERERAGFPCCRRGLIVLGASEIAIYRFPTRENCARVCLISAHACVYIQSARTHSCRGDGHLNSLAE